MSYVIHLILSIWFLLLVFALHTLAVARSRKPLASFVVVRNNLLITEYAWNLNTSRKSPIARRYWQVDFWFSTGKGLSNMINREDCHVFDIWNCTSITFSTSRRRNHISCFSPSWKTGIKKGGKRNMLIFCLNNFIDEICLYNELFETYRFTQNLVRFLSSVYL